MLHRSLAQEWKGGEEMHRSMLAEKEKAERHKEKRDRRRIELKQQNQLPQKVPSNEDWTEKILRILVHHHSLL